MGGSGSSETTGAFPRAARLLALLLIALTSQGCTRLRQWVHNGFKVGPNYCPPAAPAAEQWVDEGHAAVDSAPAEDYAWWAVFNDPTLNALIDAAYAQNLDLKATTARIAEARARRRIAG